MEPTLFAVEPTLFAAEPTLFAVDRTPPISSLNLHLEKLLTRVAFADHIFDQAGVAIIIVGRLLGV